MAVPRMELAGDGEPDATHHLDGGDGRRERGAAEIVASRRKRASRHVVGLERDDEAGEPSGGRRRHGWPPLTSRSTSRIAEWIRPLLATMAGESRFRAPPVRPVIRPPASST